MKVFLSILILIFCFQSWTKADDIRDFEIEGMSIGDSLLEYIDLNKINSLFTSQTSGSKKYKRYYEVIEVNNYEGVDVWVLENDSNYIIQSLTGFIEYTKNISECYSKKKEIVKSLENELKIKSYSYITNYDNNTSKSDVSDFSFKNGKVRVWCTDYSKKKEDKGYGDFLGVTVSDAKFLYWIDNEAYRQ